MAAKLVFGLARPPGGAPVEPALSTFLGWVGERVGVEIESREIASYQALARLMVARELDLAWLPPIAFARIERDTIDVLVTSGRGKHEGFESVLIVRRDSGVRTFEGLRGARVAWVDPWSASGYVLPRINLAVRGIDPRELFADEKFYGSHRAAITAMLDGKADVTGTYAARAERGKVRDGGWSRLTPDSTIRVLGTFGAIPADVVAVRSGLDDKVRRPLARAFVDACHHEDMQPLVLELFGVREFKRGKSSSYDGLRKAVESAMVRGLLQAITIKL
jgi:phosphate/phosphite/phosphonate ABC transporter binding protein